ncbi:MAG: orotidine-5'-phosphate decarboxylase [Bdellovibrionales bacterium]|nr:orotidine-5'-phosphate decarboxylase [Bdellovibrionales bacterium]
MRLVLSERPVFVALDVDDRDQAVSLAKQLKGIVGGFKLGPRLLVKEGESLIKDIAAHGPVFVDNKYYDIPNTMESAVRATFEAGASFCTVHATCGEEALTRLGALEQDLCETRPFLVIAVTILTSFSPETMPSVFADKKIRQHVIDLAKLSYSCGVHGIVCSPYEIADIDLAIPDSFIVAPGVRMPEDNVANDDQKRVMSPREALKEGASALVIGRPIVAAEDPVGAAKRIMESIEGSFC